MDLKNMDTSYLTDLDKHFQLDGLVKLPQFIPQKELKIIQHTLLSDLKRLNIYSSNKVLSKTLQGMSPFQQIVKLSQMLNKPKSLDITFSIIYERIIHHLSLSPLNPSIESQLLLSLPHQGQWNMEILNWHVDISAQKFQGIQVFLLIDDVQPRGGATMVLCGSHHLTQRPSLYSLRKITSRQSPGDVFLLEQQQVTIQELYGRAGDVYLMDMRLLHSPSINSTKYLRMMATSRFFLK